MSHIAFTIRLTADDWDEVMRGWQCQVLKVPGAIVEDIYIEDNRVDTARYEVLSDQNFVRWIAQDQPPRVAASIKLAEALSLDRETERWKRRAIILPVMATVMAAIISGGATYLSRTSDVHAPRVGLATPATAASPSSSLMTSEQDTDRPGLDYLHPASASDAASCQKACQADSACKSYTFVPLDRSYAGCWLKNAEFRPVYAPGLTSGARSN